MCGIAGILELKNSSTLAAQLEQLLPLLAHRGPDGSGIALSTNVGFAHTRLSILGVGSAAAKQPVNKNNDLLTFNGEIYNYRELGASLRHEGFRLSGESDTEVLFLCLRHWGVERTLSKIDGMFAFAWYCGQRKTLTLARDPLGEKPLYWSKNGKRFVFASEIKAIVAIDGFDAKPNLARMDDLLFTSKVNGTETAFKDVFEIEPGAYLSVSGTGQIATHQYWRLEDALCARVHDPGESIASQTMQLVDQAIRSRRISDVPIGVLLSGGIDSNTIVERLASQSPTSKVKLFFASNQNSEVSEKPDVDIFLRFLTKKYPEWHADLDIGLVDFERYFEVLKWITWNYDEPIQFQNTPLLSNICARAHDNGVKVLLSGEGSDEIFMGYDRFLRTAKELDLACDRHQELSILYFGGGQHSVDVVDSLTSAVSDGAEATQPWRWLDGYLQTGIDIDQLQSIFSQKYRMQTLLQRQDRVGMAHSIEIRVPFLKPGLVKWANSLSSVRKMNAKNGETKICLRSAMQNSLPERILSKPKDGFPSDMMLWLGQPIIQPVAERLILSKDSFSMNYLNADAVKKLLADHFRNRRRLDTLLWMLISLEIWHDTFWLDRRPENCSTI